MPARPSYSHRLADAIEQFRKLPGEWIDRRTVEEILGVSKTVAWRILRRCGAAEGPGNTLVCGREQLVQALANWQSSPAFEQETRRRDRLADYLERMAEIRLTRRTKVAEREEALDLVNARFDRLPAGVSLTRQRLLVEFESPEEFLQRIGAVIYALQNDYDAIRAFIEG